MKISIVTTTFNRKEFLKELLESVAKSVLIPFSDVSYEHIVYDDCSSDGTEELFLNSKWENTIYLQGEVNKGQSYGRNAAIRSASGDYIFCIDSDDIMLLRTLFNFAKLAKENPETDWFVSDFLHINKDMEYLPGGDYYHWDFKDIKEMLDSIWEGETFIQGNVFFKKSIFEKVGGFDEKMRMGEDLDLYIRFLYAKAMPKFSPLVSHLHRFHGNNLSEDISVEDHKKFVNELKKKYMAKSSLD
jgi:glycosyltransferase involved in cell wall biosynthesis